MYMNCEVQCVGVFVLLVEVCVFRLMVTERGSLTQALSPAV